MGQRKSKPSKLSYDIAPVVSEHDFQYQNNQNDNEKNKNGTINKPVTSSTSSNAEKTELQKNAEKAFDPKLIPAWLKSELFVDILKQNLPNFERILNFKAYPALSAGENYATLMLRVSIDAELNDKSTKTISFMLKVSHDNEQMKEMLKTANFFTTENGMFLDILPELEEMYKNVGVEVKFAAKAYRFPEGTEPNVVLLQDLKPYGYNNADRRECLDLEHAHWVLRKLAQFHAASATRVATKGPYKKLYMNGLFANEETMKIWDVMMAQFKESFLKNIKHFKNREKYEAQLAACLGNLTNEMTQLVHYDETEFNALVHGDCWTNNMLFKYNDADEIIDMIFVDFQLSKYDAVAHDLWYFILSSLKLDIKLKKFDYLIRYYYDHLIENLKLLNYPKKLPALREIFMQLFKYGSWTILTTVCVLPAVLLDPTDSANMENFMSANENGMSLRDMVFTNKRYHEHINEILPWLYNRGMLEPYDYSRSKIGNNKVENETTSDVSPIETLPFTTFKSPEWITETLLIDILKQHFKDFKCIKNFATSTATTGGDNYASTMLKVDIDLEFENGETSNASYMLKVALDSTEVNVMLELMNTFNKEIAMYTEILPKFEALWKAVGVDVNLAPKYFDLPQKPVKNVVLLENLRPKGFKNGDRLCGLDEKHTQAVLEKLAQFHAVSACYALENPLSDMLKKSMFKEEARPFFQKMKDAFTTLYFECIKTYENQEIYIKKVEYFFENFFDILLKTAEVNDDSFNVLNHGDVWTNNILFKHDENGNIEETCLIDYQMVNYGSPAYDLYYFLLTSTEFDIKLEKFDHHIKFYHDHLVKNLKLLNYSKHIPTLKELHEDLLKKGEFGFSILGVLTVVLLDPTEQANINNMLSEAEVGVALKRQMYNNDRYRKHADAILVWLNNRGLLDVEQV